MAGLDKTALLALIGTKLPDNTSEQITPADLREVLEAIKDSYPNLIDHSSIFGLFEYDPNVSYVTGQAAIFEGDIYQASQNTTGIFDPADWVKVNCSCVNNSGVDLYENTTVYAMDDLAAHLGVIYVSLQDTNSGQQPDVSPTYWQSVTYNSLPGKEFAEGELYFRGEIVKDNTQLYASATTNDYMIGTNFQDEVQTEQWSLVGGISIPSLILSGEVVTVPPNYSVVVYGDLIVQGTLVVHADSNITIINGILDVDGGLTDIRGGSIDSITLKTD